MSRQLTETAAWQDLAKHAASIRGQHLRQLFADDPQRFAHLSFSHGKLLVDCSKQRVTPDTMRLLHRLAEQADLRGWIARMRAGEAINHTEQRAVRHTALRAGQEAPAEVQAVLARMAEFCERVHSGQWRGYSGERITDVVNIGIGGSDLGPRMAVQALAACEQPDIRVHFVSNLDGADLASTLARLNPRSTLFVVASKTFTTLETIANARTARYWLLAAAADETAVARHFVAASTNLQATGEFGIPPANVFEFRDWVGGRFSLWSAIGLSIALAVGFRHFESLLAGGRDMDEHFFNAPAAANLPLILALLGLWNTNFLDAHSHGVFPYSHSLAQLPAYLQQLEMESNGKRADRQGATIDIATNPILWGTAGTNGQHSFFQLLHQGSELVACDFIALGRSDFPLPGHHSGLLANCLAQSSALAFGQTAEEARAAGIPEALVAYRTFPGNQPSTTIVLPELTPFTLGQLIALYEHKVFCLGVLWNLNSFDQWGVELGKQLAGRLTPCLKGEAPTGDELDASTRGLIDHLRQFRVRTMPEVVVVAAVASNRVIGRDNQLIWNIPEDMAHFKALTAGHTVVMGRKTWESLPPRFRPLPGRRNIVISRQADYAAPGAELAGSLEAALNLAATVPGTKPPSGTGTVFVIGGEQIYRQAMAIADRLEITEVDLAPAGDAWFPEIAAVDWRETQKNTPPSASGTGFSFVTYRRR